MSDKQPITLELAFSEAYDWSKRPVLAIEGYEVRLGDAPVKTQTFSEYINEKYDLSSLKDVEIFLKQKDHTLAYEILYDQLDADYVDEA